jgi:hypothetical protein
MSRPPLAEQLSVQAATPYGLVLQLVLVTGQLIRVAFVAQGRGLVSLCRSVFNAFFASSRLGAARLGCGDVLAGSVHARVGRAA